MGVGVVTLAAHNRLSLSCTFNGKLFSFFLYFFFFLVLVPVVDTTRVEILEADPEVAGSDYINANYIRVSLQTPFCVFA